MSKRFIKIMKLFKLAKEESLNQSILIDKKSFLEKLKGIESSDTVKVDQITVQV